MEYLTPNDYAKAERHGIPPDLANARFYKRGWSKERAITQPHQVRNQLHAQYKEQCDQSGISLGTFYRRIKLGMTPEQAASTPKLPHGAYLQNGGVLISQEAIQQAEANGIGVWTLKHRVYKYKWSVERAVNTPVNERFRRKDYADNKGTIRHTYL